MTLAAVSRWSLGVALGALIFAPAPARAQGAAVYPQSACMTARNGAGIAAPCNDGSAVYYNPAAIARQGGAVSFGVTVIDQSGTFVYDTTERIVERAPRSQVLPHGWATWRPAPRLGVGFGLWAPYSLELEWPVCSPDQPRCGTGFEGRFVGYDQSIRGLYFQPTVAYDLIPGRLALGVGVDIVKGEVEINRRLDLSEQPIEVAPGVQRPLSQFGIPYGTDFADVTLSGDAWGFTGHIGLLFNLTEGFSLGARYMHSVDLEFEGDADFRQVPTLLVVGPLGSIFPTQMSLDDFLAESGVFEPGARVGDQGFSAPLTLPAQAVAGLSFQLDPTLRVMVDYQWTQWSDWDVVPVEFGGASDSTGAPDETLILDYQDAATYRLGVDYALTDRATLRAGFTFAEAAARDASVSPFLPDSDRAFYSAGFSYRASERLSLELFGMGVNAADRRGRVVDRESLDDTAAELNDGIYTAAGSLFGVTVTYHLGGPR